MSTPSTPASTGAQARDLPPGALIGIGVVAVSAAVLSFSSLTKLAESTGYNGKIFILPVAVLLPVALDIGIGVATYVWLRAVRSEVIRLARAIAWAAIILSVVGNGAQHAFEAADVEPGWIVAVIVGAVAPAMFGAIVHLAVVASSPPPDTTYPVATPLPVLRNDGQGATEAHESRVDVAGPQLPDGHPAYDPQPRLAVGDHSIVDVGQPASATHGPAADVDTPSPLAPSSADEVRGNASTVAHRLVALRAEHGRQSKHKERAALGVGWGPYNDADAQLNGHHPEASTT